MHAGAWDDSFTIILKHVGRAQRCVFWVQFKTVAPVGDRVLVKVDVSEEKSTGGILLPSSAQKKPTQGEITAAGSAKAVKVSALGAHYVRQRSGRRGRGRLYEAHPWP